MKFLSILREMAVSDALALFKIERSDLSDSSFLKKRYRTLSKKHHPDKPGGSKQMMQQVNDAYETLKGVTASASGRVKVDWKAIEAENLEKSIFVRDDLTKQFNPKAFTDYFKGIYNVPFKHEILKTWPEKDAKRSDGGGFVVQFYAKDKDPLFHLRVSGSIRDSAKSLGGAGITYTTFTDAYGLINLRKIKMGRSDWKWTNKHAFLTNPDKVFPQKVLEKNIKAGKRQAFKKRDMYTALAHRLKARNDADWTRIPVGKVKGRDGYHILIYRMLFRRIPYWGANGLYKFSRVAQLPFFSMPESEDTIKVLEDIQNAVKSHTDEKKLAATITKMLKNYKAELTKEK